MRVLTCIRCFCSDARGRSRSPFCWDCRHERLKEGRAAHSKVHGAVVKGLLTPIKQCVCVDCSRPAYDYDHRDYTKPLDVAPVCRGCNQRRGPAFDSKYRPQPAMA